MTTIVARPLGSRASAHRSLLSCAAALPFLTAAAVLANTRVWLTIGAVAAVVAVVVRHDARHSTIPDRWVLLAACIPFATALAGLVEGEQTWVDVIAGAAVMGALPLLLHCIDPSLFGFGDIKLAATLGAALGVLDPTLGIVALAVAAFVGLCQMVGYWRSRVALGPALLVGFEVAAISVMLVPGAAA